MVVQDCEELFSAKLEHISVPFEFEHTAPQGLRIFPGQRRPPSMGYRILTFDSEKAQVVDARFVNEVIGICELVHDGDLTEIEGESKYIIIQLTSLRTFRSSLKHLVKIQSEGASVTAVAPAGLLSSENG